MLLNKFHSALDSTGRSIPRNVARQTIYELPSAFRLPCVPMGLEPMFPASTRVSFQLDDSILMVFSEGASLHFQRCRMAVGVLTLDELNIVWSPRQVFTA